ncbi:hypothetical protein ACSNOH_20590 [Streptomyces sp. URMC 127]|uniref:hypothetical protein n=1 Tax=Streptomyces sp. URMC 127 TaxID=3423402 RepID=UPI003F1C7BDA
MRELIETAHQKGFSGKGAGTEESRGPGFVVMPYHPETSPEASWKCFAFALPPKDAEPGIPESGLGGPYRLDLAAPDFYALPKVRRKTRDFFLARLVWAAAARRRSD